MKENEEDLEKLIRPLQRLETLYALLDEIPPEDIVDIQIGSENNAEKYPILGESEERVFKEATEEIITITIRYRFGKEWAAKQLAELSDLELVCVQQLQEINKFKKKYREMIANG